MLPARREEIPSLTELRFCAAACVVWAHGLARYFQPLDPHALGDTWRVGRIGMTLFFVLSGFVIHYNYGEALSGLKWRAIWNFAVARFARLYPLYLFVLLLTLALTALIHGGSRNGVAEVA